MSKAILIQADDWEGLFTNGKLVKEGHSLNEGTSRIKFLIQLSKKYNFNLEELKEVWVEDEDNEYLNRYGGFPDNLSELQGDYENMEEE